MKAKRRAPAYSRALSLFTSAEESPSYNPSMFIRHQISIKIKNSSIVITLWPDFRVFAMAITTQRKGDVFRRISFYTFGGRGNIYSMCHLNRPIRAQRFMRPMATCLNMSCIRRIVGVSSVNIRNIFLGPRIYKLAASSYGHEPGE